MSTFTYIATAADTSSYASSVVIPKPTGTAEDDFMLALLLREDQTTEPNSVPSGWTKIDYNTNMGVNFRYSGIYYKVAGASEGSDYTFGWSGSDGLRGQIATYRGGFNISDPIDAYSNTLYGTSDTNLQAATATAAANNSPAIFCGGAYQESSLTFTPPSGWAEDVDAGDTSSDIWLTFASKVIPAGATGTLNATMSATLASKHAFLIILNPEISTANSLFFGGGF